MKNYLCIASIFKNEACYLKEWLDFHIAEGVDIFYLYDNRSEDKPLQVLQPYIDDGMVVYNYIGERPKQQHIYDTYVKYREDIEWLAILDLDEFLHSTNQISLKDNVKSLDNKGICAISVNWQCFGSNAQKKYVDKPVRERFTKKALPLYGLNFATKPIFKLQYLDIHRSSGAPHMPELCGKQYFMSTGRSAAENRRLYATVIRNNWVHGIRLLRNWVLCPEKDATMIIDHYKLKSQEEFLGKAGKGHRLDRYSMAQFLKYDKHLSMVDTCHE